MLGFDNDDDDDEDMDDLPAVTTYHVRARDGRIVRMIGDTQDLDEIAALMRRSAAAPDLLSICEKIALWTCTDETKEGGGFAWFAEELVPELFAAIAAAKGEATVEPGCPCEM